jgi:hypothetical protein
MHRAVQCVALSDWTEFRTIYRQLPYVENVLETDWSAVKEYYVVDRVVLNDNDFKSIQTHLIQGSILVMEDFVRYVSENDVLFNVGNLLDDHVDSNIGCYTDRSDESLCKKATSNEDNSAVSCDYLNLINVDDCRQTCPLKEFLLSISNRSVKQESVLNFKQKQKTCSSTSVDTGSRRSDWKVMDYVLDHSSRETSFVTALSLADQAAFPRCNWGKSSKLRRIRMSANRVRDIREAFVNKYNISSSSSETSFDVIQERLISARKLVILLDHELVVLAGPVRTLKGRLISDLLVLIKCPSEVWYPASRTVIGMVMRKFANGTVTASKHVYN